MRITEESLHKAEFAGIARISRVPSSIARGLAQAKITPQDLSNPVSFQLAFSRLYEALIKSLEKGEGETYVAEVKFVDSLGNEVTFAVDMGEEPPAFSSDTVRVRVIVEFYE